MDYRIGSLTPDVMQQFDLASWAPPALSVVTIADPSAVPHPTSSGLDLPAPGWVSPCAFWLVILAVVGAAAVLHAVAIRRTLQAFAEAAAKWQQGDMTFRIRPSRFWSIGSRRIANACNATIARIAEGYSREHAIAAALQSKLTRSLPTSVGPFTMASRTIAGSDEADVGGDFIASSWIDSNHFRVLLGDVEGNGLRAAAEVAEFIYPLEALSRCGFDIPAVLAYANRVARERRITATLAIVRLEISTGLGRIALAGHEPPLLWRQNTGTWERSRAHQPLLGVVESSDCTPTDIEFGRGDILLLYSDGFASVGPRKGHWSVDDLAEVAETGPRTPRELVDYLVGHLPAPSDDATIIALRYEDEGSSGASPRSA